MHLSILCWQHLKLLFFFNFEVIFNFLKWNLTCNQGHHFWEVLQDDSFLSFTTSISACEADVQKKFFIHYLKKILKQLISIITSPLPFEYSPEEVVYMTTRKFSLLLMIVPEFLGTTQQTKTCEEHKIIWCISHEWPVIIPS